MSKQLNANKFESSTQLEDIYKVACDTTVSVIVEGDHGIGKSESVYSFAKSNNFHVEALFLSHQEVADLIGIPTLEKDEDGHPLTTWSKPIWLHRLEMAAKAGKRCILFLDELNRAQTEVRQAALQLVLDKQIHEHHLPKTIVNGVAFDTFVVAAINPSDGFYQVDELDPALMDRFLHFKLHVNADSWLTWAVDSGVHKTIVNYISNSKDKLYVKDENAALFPTPRSWTKLSELLKSYEDKNIENQALLYNLISGKIGHTVGAQFLTYYKENSVIVSVEDIAKLVKKAYPLAAKKHGEATVEAIDEVAEKIMKLIEPLEIPLLKELSSNLVDTYLNDSGKVKFEDAKPLICYMHALPIEQLAAVIKELQVDSEDKSNKKYDNLAEIAPGKAIFRRIVKKVKKLSIE
jgi:hypothetical protein